MTEAEIDGKAAGESGVPGAFNPYAKWSEEWFAWFRAFLRAGGTP